MGSLLTQIESLSPFVQSLLGAAVFGVSSLLIQWLFRRAKSKGSLFLREYSRIDVLRHILHRDYVNSTEMIKANYGSGIATLFAFRWMLGGFLIAIFFIGVHSIVNSSWLFVAASWFCFNCFLEAYNWAKDSSAEKSIKHVPEDLRKEVTESVYPAENKAVQDNSE